MSINYYSAVYKINHKKQTVTRVTMKEYDHGMFQRNMDFKTLVQIITKMQKICFQDANTNRKNTIRLKKLLSETYEPTVCIVISLGFLENEKNIMNFVDGGCATLQKTNLGFLKYQQPVVNEVCRSKYNKNIALGKPIENVLNIIDKYAVLMTNTSKNINGVYLYVEKQPEHGSSSFLTKYYEKYGFSVMLHEDEEYIYMYKKLQH